VQKVNLLLLHQSAKREGTFLTVRENETSFATLLGCQKVKITFLPNIKNSFVADEILTYFVF
jgi:hypothetical protein